MEQLAELFGKSIRRTAGDEIAWKIDDIYEIIEAAIGFNRIILGGDILDSNMSHTGDSWYYIPCRNSNITDNIAASIEHAKEYISKYIFRNGSNYYVVVVLSNTIIV